MLPFVFSSVQAYALEVGDLYMRVYKDLGQVLSGGFPYEIAMPYAEADLPDLNYTQSGDTMFLFHPTKPTVKLTRSGHAAWKQVNFPFFVEAHDEVGITPNTGVTLSAATVGAARIATAAAAAFQPSDVGRQLTSGDGVLQITGFTDTQHVTGDITVAFAGVNLAALGWTLTESPKTGLTPSATGPIGTQINLTLDAAGWQNDAVRSCIGHYVHINGGVVEINGLTSTTVVTGIVRSLLTGATKAGSDYWSEESKIWSVANGYPRCGALHEQRLVLGGTTLFPNAVWGSRTGLYDDFTNGAADDDGFAFFLVAEQQNPVQQLVSSTHLLPLGYGGEFSMRGGVERPITPTNCQVKQDSTYGVKSVRPVKVGREILMVQRAGRKVLALTFDGMSDRWGGVDLTILAEHITTGGVIDAAYSQEPDSVVAFVRADGQLVTLTRNADQEVIGWARQVTDGVVESVCSIPYGDKDQLWMIVQRTVNGATKRYVEVMEFNSDITLNRQTDASVTGALLPDQHHRALVGRRRGDRADGRAARPWHRQLRAHRWRRAERLQRRSDGGHGAGADTITYALEADPGVETAFGTLTPLAKVWAGFAHLEAKMLDVVADGVVFPQVQVIGGQITLPRAVATLEAGLHYETTLVTLTPELMLPEGTTQGRPVSLSEVVVRLYNSIGCKVENEQVPFRKFGAGILDKPVAPFTGDKKVDILGWARGKQLTIKQTQPLPLCVLAIIKRVTVGD
jgi:hypothetical protein